jgi:hypothetical protein
MLSPHLLVSKMLGLYNRCPHRDLRVREGRLWSTPEAQCLPNLDVTFRGKGVRNVVYCGHSHEVISCRHTVLPKPIFELYHSG